MQHKITKRPSKHRFNQHSFAHRLVASLQLDMAHAVYDELARKDNKFYREWNETEFVNMIAPTLRAQARQTLAEMLSQPGTSEAEKEEIYTALILDAQIPNEDVWIN